MLPDITGQKFGRLTAVCATGLRKNRNVIWECICDCGRTKVVSRGYLRTGRVKSCGCLNLDSQRETHTKHGMSASATYMAWKDMKRRCSSKRAINWHRYGGRGITVCDRWLASFDNFLADMGPRPDGLTLERKDNDGNYEPGNCVWASRFDQASNTSRNRYVEIDGIKRTVSEWARAKGISKVTLRNRLNSGTDPRKAVCA